MTELLESGDWQGRIYSGGWVEGHGGTAARSSLLSPKTGEKTGYEAVAGDLHGQLRDGALPR